MPNYSDAALARAFREALDADTKANGRAPLGYLMIEARARELDAARVGDYVLVPREPTEAMLRAGGDALPSGDVAPADVLDAYRAMLAAAPSAAKPVRSLEWLESATEEAAGLEMAAELLRLFVGAAYPVAAEINPRGYNWSEAYLDQALAAYRAAAPSAADDQWTVRRCCTDPLLNSATSRCVHCGATYPLSAAPSAVAPEGEAFPEYVIALLTAAGYVTQAKVDEARKIALGILPAPLAPPAPAGDAVARMERAKQILAAECDRSLEEMRYEHYGVVNTQVALRAIAAALQSSGREGMVLVPREPTDDMIRAGLGEIQQQAQYGNFACSTVYRAMLAAAQEKNRD